MMLRMSARMRMRAMFGVCVACVSTAVSMGRLPGKTRFGHHVDLKVQGIPVPGTDSGDRFPC
ncbi:hypothetical protein GGR33_004407 [Methylobacterium brachythecii]|uniref:Secreted protein n=1 Tax=Methylobacterium brachythecii TaxID=1176177 RepID=A0A7W6F985_9HYPH|nr:hypothetical protein [Methylobacterium brachythecii]